MILWSDIHRETTRFEVLPLLTPSLEDWYGLAIATNRPETEDSDEEPEQNNDGFETKKDKVI